MGFTALALLAGVALFVGMLVAIEAGRRLGARQKENDPEGAFTGTGAIDGAVFGLLGLLLAFAFAGAEERFDARRHLVVEETNDIGTAYLRIDLLPASEQPAIRDLFRRYVDVRIDAYRALPDVARAKAKLAESTKLQGEIWSRSVAAARMDGVHPATPILVLNALNTMIDITTTRSMATQMHPPIVIFVMLYALALEGALLAGFDLAARRRISWIHAISFAAITSLAVYVVCDLELPRLGLIRVDSFDQALVDLRRGMD